ncbi:MAG: pentapeptide repeat-containing protein [Myxococcota bacterium]
MPRAPTKKQLRERWSGPEVDIADSIRDEEAPFGEHEGRIDLRGLTAPRRFFFSRTQWDGVDLTYADLSKSYAYTVFRNCVFDRAEMLSTVANKFTHCSFKGANFHRPGIVGTYESCDFRLAKFRVARFPSASVFRSCDFSEARFMSASFNRPTFESCSFDGARMKGGTLGRSTFKDCTFHNFEADHVVSSAVGLPDGLLVDVNGWSYTVDVANAKR